MNDKVVIMGQGPRSMEHPSDHEVWVVNGPSVPPRWGVLFQLHGIEHLKTKHFDKGDGLETLMVSAAILNSKRLITTESAASYISGLNQSAKPEVFPMPSVAAYGNHYFTNSFAWVIAYAVFNYGAKHICLDGIMFGDDGGKHWGASEAWAVPCIEYHIGRAEALGVEVVFSPGTGLFRRNDFLYGYEGPGSI